MEYIIQGISIAGMACHISSFQIKKNSVLFFMQTLGSLLFLIHYFMLGEMTGAIMNVLGVTRGLVFLQGEKLRKPWVLGVLWILTIGCVIITWDGIKCLLPLIAMLASTTAMHLNNGKVIRFAQLFATSPCWLIYNIIVGSLGGTLCEAFIMTSTIISFIRYGIDGFEKAEE